MTFGCCTVKAISGGAVKHSISQAGIFPLMRQLCKQSMRTPPQLGKHVVMRQLHTGMHTIYIYVCIYIDPKICLVDSARSRRIAQ